MKNRIAVMVGATLIVCALGVSTAGAAPGPPLPKAANGKKVTRFATGIAVPTAFAWAKGSMFVAGGAEGPKVPGGLYVIKKGTRKPVLIPRTTKSAYGLAYDGAGKFYVSTGKTIEVYGKWNGKKFGSKRTILKANQKDYTSFNGVSIAPDGRIYAGVSFEHDHAASDRKYASSVISFTKSGGDVKVISKGIRQPWQLTFLDGEEQPFVTALGQDGPKGTDAADFVFKADPDTDYGFPACTWGVTSNCESYTEPTLIFPPEKVGKRTVSPSPTGITHRGEKLFIAMFGGFKKGPLVISTNSTGSVVEDAVTGFVAPVVGVGVHKGHLYVSDLTATIYKVKL